MPSGKGGEFEKNEANLRQQMDAVRRRLMRELWRTLRCLGSGDLNTFLHKQVQSKTSPERRYHRAIKLLNGFPKWTQEEANDVEEFVRFPK